ncbi:MAG: phosphodiester glycosidase family protein [Chitinophagaceae bacterium]
MLRCYLTFLFISAYSFGFTQLNWTNVDSLFQPLPKSIHVYKTTDSVDGKPNIAFYVIADLKDKTLDFTTDTTHKRRFTPLQFYQKNNQPLVVVNCTFFSFETNQNLNVVIKNGRLAAHNAKTIKSPTDTSKRLKVYNSAIEIRKNRKADVAWIKTDSSNKYTFASQEPIDPATKMGNWYARQSTNSSTRGAVTTSSIDDQFKKWKVKTAVGGGPVLLQNAQIKITNEEERMFAGKAINDKHPRTAMGYTADGKLIILVIQGRYPGVAEGATLTQEAQIFKDLGCVEALNLDGGGSSCMLVNGKETITPSDKGMQRAIPAVFIIKK